MLLLRICQLLQLKIHEFLPAIMTNVVLFHCYCCHHVDPEHNFVCNACCCVVWDPKSVIWLPGWWIKPKEADAYGSDVLFWQSELSGGIWEHITQSVEWYAPWELKESIILSMSLLFISQNLLALFSLASHLTLFSVIPAQNCSGLRTCGLCLEQPDCGWCGDPSNTGRGQCMEGSYRGPMKSPSKQIQDMVLETGLCPKERGFEWAFIQCPGESHKHSNNHTQTWPLLKSKCSTRGFQTLAQGPPEGTKGC